MKSRIIKHDARQLNDALKAPRGIEQLEVVNEGVDAIFNVSSSACKRHIAFDILLCAESGTEVGGRKPGDNLNLRFGEPMTPHKLDAV